MLSECMALVLAIAPLATGGGHRGREGEPDRESVVASGGERVDTRRAAAPDGVVELDGAGGAVRIVGWDRAEVAVTGTLGAGADGLELSGGGRRTRISIDVEGNPNGVVSDLEIHVPAASRIEVDVMAADVTVTEVTGTVTVDTVGGSIHVSGSAREINLESVNGSVEAACACTRAHAESVNGAVTVKGARGEVEASTVNGALTVTGSQFERAKLETVNGRVLFDGELHGHATLEVESVGGSVELRLPASTDADFTVNTFSGSIRNAWGTEGRRTSRYTREEEVVFTTGSGGATVNVQTLSGDVVLTKR